MKKKIIKGILYILLTSLMVALLIPALHLYRTKRKEHKSVQSTPPGYSNDASQLNLTKVDTVIFADTSISGLEKQIRDLILLSKERNVPISIAGAQHSMGGHTLFPNGILIQMRTHNFVCIDTVQHTVTAGAGALWEDMIHELDKAGKSIKVMQAFSSFSIGGSISVNGHGWQQNAAPVSSTVKSFRIMDAEGRIIRCSPDENAELFGLAIGGYGLFGVILDVTLEIVDNSSLRYRRIEFPTQEYTEKYNTFVTQDSSVELAFGRLNISKKNFLNTATLNTFTREKHASKRDNSPKDIIPEEWKRLIFRSSVNSEYGKKLRWDLESAAGYLGPKYVMSRNQLLNDPVSMIENRDSTSTDILQEYFIPKRNFQNYTEDLKNLLPHPEIDLLNITIREVRQDTLSFLNYAREDAFAFVFLFNQRKSNDHEKEMRTLTQALTDIAINHGGTFYLPYQLHTTKEQMRKAYPQADDFFELKLKYDRQEVFRNKFYEHYK